MVYRAVQLITVLFFLLILLFIILPKYLLTIIIIQGKSMSPALEPGDRVLILKRFYSFLLKKGSVVVCNPDLVRAREYRVQYIKRILACYGDEVTVENTNGYINIANKLDDYSANYDQYIPKNHYFVCGDNIRSSVDSRMWGTIKRQCIFGVVIIKLAN